MLSSLQIWDCRVCGVAFEPRPYQRPKYDRTCIECRRAEGRVATTKYQASPAGRVAVLVAKRRRYHTLPEHRAKAQARARTHWAIKAGKLQRQPCEICGADQVDAHHDDYAAPLNVRWLCRPHHLAHHGAAQ